MNRVSKYDSTKVSLVAYCVKNANYMHRLIIANQLMGT